MSKFSKLEMLGSAPIKNLRIPYCRPSASGISLAALSMSNNGASTRDLPYPLVEYYNTSGSIEKVTTLVQNMEYLGECLVRGAGYVEGTNNIFDRYAAYSTHEIETCEKRGSQRLKTFTPTYRGERADMPLFAKTLFSKESAITTCSNEVIGDTTSPKVLFKTIPLRNGVCELQLTNMSNLPEGSHIVFGVGERNITSVYHSSPNLHHLQSVMSLNYESTLTADSEPFPPEGRYIRYSTPSTNEHTISFHIKKIDGSVILYDSHNKLKTTITEANFSLNVAFYLNQIRLILNSSIVSQYNVFNTKQISGREYDSGLDLMFNFSENLFTTELPEDLLPSITGTGTMFSKKASLRRQFEMFPGSANDTLNTKNYTSTTVLKVGIPPGNSYNGKFDYIITNIYSGKFEQVRAGDIITIYGTNLVWGTVDLVEEYITIERHGLTKVEVSDYEYKRKSRHVDSLLIQDRTINYINYHTGLYKDLIGYYNADALRRAAYLVNDFRTNDGYFYTIQTGNSAFESAPIPIQNSDFTTLITGVSSTNYEEYARDLCILQLNVADFLCNRIVVDKANSTVYAVVDLIKEEEIPIDNATIVITSAAVNLYNAGNLVISLSHNGFITVDGQGPILSQLNIANLATLNLSVKEHTLSNLGNENVYGNEIPVHNGHFDLEERIIASISSIYSKRGRFIPIGGSLHPTSNGVRLTSPGYIPATMLRNIIVASVRTNTNLENSKLVFRANRIHTFVADNHTLTLSNGVITVKFMVIISGPNSGIQPRVKLLELDPDIGIASNLPSQRFTDLFDITIVSNMSSVDEKSIINDLDYDVKTYLNSSLGGNSPGILIVVKPKPELVSTNDIDLRKFIIVENLDEVRAAVRDINI